MSALFKFLIFFISFTISSDLLAQNAQISLFDLAGNGDFEAIIKQFKNLDKSEILELVNERGRRERTPLMLATILSKDEEGNIKDNHIKIIEILIDKGTDLYKADRRGRTVLEYAVKDEQKKLVILYLENGDYSNEVIDEIIESWEKGMEDPSIIDELKIYKASRMVSKSFIEKCPHMISENELPGMTKILTQFTRTIQDDEITATIDDMQKIICKKEGRNFKEAIFNLQTNAEEADSIFKDIENAPTSSAK